MDRSRNLIQKIQAIRNKSGLEDRHLETRLLNLWFKINECHDIATDAESLDLLDKLTELAILTGVSAGHTLHADEVCKLRTSQAALNKGRLRGRSPETVESQKASWQRLADEFSQQTQNKFEIARRIKKKTGCWQSAKTISNNITIARLTSRAKNAKHISR